MIISFDTKCSQCDRPVTVRADLIAMDQPKFNTHLKTMTTRILLTEIKQCVCGWRMNAVLCEAEPLNPIMAYNEVNPVHPIPDYVGGDRTSIQVAGGDIVGGDLVR